MSNPRRPTHLVIHRVPQYPEAYRALSIASWILIILTCGLSLVPLFGFTSWVIAVPVFLATFIMAIIILTRGGTLQGILLLLLLTSILFGPGMVAVAPFVSSAIGIGGAVAAAVVHEESLARAIAIRGQWQRDNRVLVSYLADGTFDIEGRPSPVGRWNVAGYRLTVSMSDTNETETIVSVSDTELVTQDRKGQKHTHTKHTN